VGDGRDRSRIIAYIVYNSYGAGMHTYRVSVTWTGNDGEGTATYRSYRRDHVVSAAGRPAIDGSSDPAFRGSGARWNPEQLLVVSLSQCHMLWYLHLCAEAGVVVVDYRDEAEGTMEENADGSGRFTSVTLRPAVAVADAAMVERAGALHHDVPARCFIARSVNFPVRHEPTVSVASAA
jgi:organic hydroperoxide reductase OsmC/OhrA